MFEFHVELMQNKFNFTLLVRNSGDVSLTELGKAFVNNLHKKNTRQGEAGSSRQK